MIKTTQKIQRHLDLLKYSLRIARARRQPLLATIRRARWLYRKKRFFAHEAYAAGLLRLDRETACPEGFVSRRVHAQIQRKINPASWAPLLNDKGMFYRFCQQHQLPIPELYALYFPQCPGYCPQEATLQGRQWIDFINRQLPESFIVKPCVGYRGQDIIGLSRRSNGRFTSSLQEEMTAEDLLTYMRSRPAAQGFVIQERLRAHHDLVALTGQSNLQTVRILTYVDPQMNLKILYGYIKLLTQETVVDNVGEGLTGTLRNLIDVPQGIIRDSFIVTQDGGGDRRVTHHPGTGQELADTPIPHWQEACDLAQRAARLFLPVRLIGWDIGITDQGPQLIEGNIWSDRFCHDPHYINILRADSKL